MPDEIVPGRDRMDALLAAVLAFSAGLELDTTLHRIVTAAAELVGARYGALAVLDEDGRTTGFAVTGVDAATRDRIGPPPAGHGVLGALVTGGIPVRLADVGAHPAAGGFPPGHPPMRSFVGVPLLVRGAVLGRLYLSSERPFTADDERAIVALAAAAGIAVDNARLYEETRSRQRWLEATGEISAELLGGTDVHEVLRLIANRAVELTGADDALIALPAEVGGALVVTVCAGPDADVLTGRRIPLDGSTSGAVLRDHVPRSVPSLAFDLADGLGVHLGPALAVRLRSGESTAGVLLAIRAPGAARFDEHELQIVSAFADQAALALRDAESQAARRELDVVVDRDRIARDLHDLVIQRLFAAGLSMQSLRRLTTSDAAAGTLHNVTAELDETIRELRNTIYSLNDSATEMELLSSRVLQAVRTAAQSLRFVPRLTLTGPIDAIRDDDTASNILAVVTEGLSNAIRHSGADSIRVSVAVDEGFVCVAVRDDGTGFSVASPGNGLTNMQHRANKLGGTFEVSSSPETGTALRWAAPVF